MEIPVPKENWESTGGAKEKGLDPSACFVSTGLTVVLSFRIEVQLTYNITVVSGVQHSDLKFFTVYIPYKVKHWLYSLCYTLHPVSLILYTVACPS